MLSRRSIPTFLVMMLFLSAAAVGAETVETKDISMKFVVKGLYCPVTCPPVISDLLKKVDGFKELKVTDFYAKTVEVVLSKKVDQSSLVDALNGSKFELLDIDSDEAKKVSAEGKAPKDGKPKHVVERIMDE